METKVTSRKTKGNVEEILSQVIIYMNKRLKIMYRKYFLRQ